jgi:hypothetical protein
MQKISSKNSSHRATSVGKLKTDSSKQRNQTYSSNPGKAGRPSGKGVQRRPCEGWHGLVIVETPVMEWLS